MAAEQRIILPYAPRRVFLPYHARAQRWSCIVAHRRCGKTVACINDMIKRALILQRSHGRICLCRAIPGSGQGGGMGISEALRGADYC